MHIFYRGNAALCGSIYNVDSQVCKFEWKLALASLLLILMIKKIKKSNIFLSFLKWYVIYELSLLTDSCLLLAELQSHSFFHFICTWPWFTQRSTFLQNQAKQSGNKIVVKLLNHSKNNDYPKISKVTRDISNVI